MDRQRGTLVAGGHANIPLKKVPIKVMILYIFYDFHVKEKDHAPKPSFFMNIAENEIEALMVIIQQGIDVNKLILESNKLTKQSITDRLPLELQVAAGEKFLSFLRRQSLRK